MLCHLTDKRVWAVGQHSIVASAVMRQLERKGALCCAN
jgi:hypothetical protein